MARKKPTAETTPPAPYVTAPEWLRDVQDNLKILRDNVLKLKIAKGAFEEGTLTVDEWESTEVKTIEDIDYNTQTLGLALDRAIYAADALETAKTDIQAAIVDAWNKIRRISV